MHFVNFKELYEKFPNRKEMDISRTNTFHRHVLNLASFWVYYK